MPKRPVRYEKQKKARERALKERKALSYEDVPLEQYDQEEIKLKRPPKKVIRLLLILVLCSLAVILWANRESLSPGGQLVSEHLAGDGSRQRLSHADFRQRSPGGEFSAFGLSRRSGGQRYLFYPIQ